MWQGVLGRALLGAAIALAVAPQAGAADPIVLGPDGAAFWDGTTANDGDSFTFPLKLTGPAERLRIAIDTPSREDSFSFEAVAPDGSLAGSASNSNQFNEELFVEDPAPGDWTVNVVADGATRAFFRMRAKLERQAPQPPPGIVAMLPNLKTVPPYEFGFVAPANPANGVYPPDTVNPPLDVAGAHPLSCTADEMAPKTAGGFEAQRCLRLTSGPINVGDGPYDMRFSFTEDVAAGEGTFAPDGGTIQRGPIVQAIHFSDNSVEFRDAGTYSFHVTHAHFHDDNVLTYDLLRVVDADAGTLEPAGGGTKSGFCPADQLFGEWHRFAQQPSGYFGEGDSVSGGNCFSFSEGFIGLTVGWGDIYRWQRPGQYVEFGSNGDGLYVVQSTVDKQNETLESNENDNTAYALIKVVGERVDLLERGQGESPWDPEKVVFRGRGPTDLGEQPAASPPATEPEPRCLVPRVKRLRLRGAKRKLRAAGCALGKVSRPRKRTGKRLVVVAQRPGAGWERKSGAKVSLRLGPKKR